jgi:CheY-like chemotaxis protein
MEKKTVLLVDDSDISLMTGELVLRKVGQFEIRKAHNGEEAVEMAMAEPPDLIVLDVVMPKMGGFDVCRALRACPATRGVPILMATTRGESHNIKEGFAAGCNDYVTKPLNHTEVAEKLSGLLDD